MKAVQNRLGIPDYDIRVIAKYHNGSGIKDPVIDMYSVDEIPVLNLTKTRLVNVALKNRAVECLMYQHDYNENKEVGLLVQVFDPYNVLWQQLGSMDRVYLDDRFKIVSQNSNFRSLVFIHNHPHQAGLSVADMLCLMNNSSLAAMIAVGNQCDRQFAMIKRPQYNDLKAQKFCRKLRLKYGRYNKNNNFVRWIYKRAILNNLHNLGLEYITNTWWIKK